ncbi:MAG: hypothetical protein ACYC6J_08605 [Coriobacteriia bacterium]
MNQELSIKCGGIAFDANMLSRTIYVAPCHVPEALGAILEAFDAMADSSTLCQALADHPDFCELAARVACVKSLRSELADRDLTSAERAALDQLTSDPCDWVRNEARGALDDLANPLPDQVAAHDGAEDFEPELRTFESRGVTVEDHGRLNYIRANSTGEIRDRAGALLVQLAGAAK